MAFRERPQADASFPGLEPQQTLALQGGRGWGSAGPDKEREVTKLPWAWEEVRWAAERSSGLPSGGRISSHLSMGIVVSRSRSHQPHSAEQETEAERGSLRRSARDAAVQACSAECCPTRLLPVGQLQNRRPLTAVGPSPWAAGRMALPGGGLGAEPCAVSRLMEGTSQLVCPAALQVPQGEQSGQ